MTVALVAGSFAIAMTTADFVQSRLGASAVTKAPTGKDLSARKKLSLKAKVMQGPLVPGVKRPLKVTMHNPLSKPLKVTAVTVQVKKPKAAGCLKTWVKASSFKSGKKKKAILVKPHKRAKVMLTVQLKNLRSVNQDACKHTQIPLRLKATARQT